MKILYQDALRNPTGWQEIDAAEWAGLPKRPIPLPGQLGGLSNTPGWVRSANIQGLTAEGWDHIAIEPVIIGLDTGVRLTVWNDDPEDYPIGERRAIVYTILPLAPDPNLGMAINTRQSSVRYAEGERWERWTATSLENASVRPWSEFVPPPAAITRHGVWLTDAKHAEHVERAPHSEWGWMHWVDHLPDSEVELDDSSRRVLREQRAQGRYRRSERTITYYQRNTDRAVGAYAATHEDALELTTAGSATESVTVGAATVLCWFFSTPANEPNSTNWDGVFHTQLNCTALSAGMNYQQQTAAVSSTAEWNRLSSDLASNLESEVQSIGGSPFTTTGLKLITSGSEAWTTPGATDRFGFGVIVSGDGHGDAITLTLNTTDSYADGPWTTGAIVLDAASGSYAISGAAATTLHNYLLDAASGSYAVTGVAATTSHGLVLLADPGSYALSGSAATTLFNRLLDAVSGVYSLSGQAATMARGLFMEAALGTYSIAGAAAEFLIGRLVDAVSGVYSISGQTASALWTHLLDAAFGTYSLVGSDAEISKGQLLDADSGSYALSGADASLQSGHLLDASPGTYALTGSPAEFAEAEILSADLGIYSLTGQDAITLYDRLLDAVADIYSLVGSDASPLVGHLLSADPGSYAATGFDATLTEQSAYEVNAEPDSYAITGLAATLLHTHILVADSGSYLVSGQSATTVSGHLTTADPGSYVITGSAAELVYTPSGAVVLSADPGSYSLSGSPAELIYTPTPVPPTAGDAAYTPSGGWARVLASIRNPLPAEWWRQVPWRVQPRVQPVELQVIVYRHLVISYSGLGPRSLVQQPTTSVYPTAVKAQLTSGAKSAILSPLLSITYPSLHTKAAHPISILQPPTASLSSPSLIVWTEKQYRDDLDDLVALGILDPDDRDRELLELIGRR